MHGRMQNRSFFHLWVILISAPLNHLIQKKLLQQLSLASGKIVVKAPGNPFDVGQAAGRAANEVLGELQSLVGEMGLSGAGGAARAKDYRTGRAKG